MNINILIEEYSFYNKELKTLRKELEFFNDIKYDTKDQSNSFSKINKKTYSIKDNVGKQILRIEDEFDFEIKKVCLKIDNTLEKKRKVEKFLESLDSKEKEVIKLRCIDKKSWKEISKIMHYSPRYLQKIKKRTLKN